MPRQPTTPRRPAPVHVGLLRAYPRRAPSESDPRWYWQVVVHQDDAQATIPGASGRYTVAEVTQILAGLVAEHGYDVPTERPGPAVVTTVGELLRAWLAEQLARESRGTLARRTYQVYYTAVVTWTDYCGGDALPLFRDRRHLQQRTDALARLRHRGQRSGRTGYAPRTVELLLRVLRAAWRWGAEEEPPLVSGPLPRVEAPRIDRDTHVYRHHTPTSAEVWALLPLLGRPWQRVAVVLLRVTGARVGELGRLDWAGVDLDAGEMTLRGKTGRRVVPLQRWVVALLEAWRPDPATRTGRLLGVAPSTVGHRLGDHIVAACQQAGREPWTPHGLRRLRSWELISQGIDAATYAALMGHTLEEGLRSYARATPAARRAASGSLPPPPALLLEASPVQSPCTDEE